MSMGEVHMDFFEQNDERVCKQIANKLLELSR